MIKERVAAAFGISPEDLIGHGRAGAAVRARQIAIYLTRELTDLSLPQIGRAFGGRDHSTVLSSIRRIESRLSSDPELEGHLHQLRHELHTLGPDAA